ncbi:hypothetical protein RND71_042611 [Anisodus tanguticus]|uniref:Uncharacterized protein n=1 Tax=Anisodus tanguticus TaxID=243964 RepID=A0AAE1UUY8_9SOLA|nr:hypothetical protein RND71_042611 [Anisodus tanguticus]
MVETTRVYDNNLVTGNVTIQHMVFTFPFDSGRKMLPTTYYSSLLDVYSEYKEMHCVVKLFEKIPHQITFVLDQVSGFTKLRSALNGATLNFRPGSDMLEILKGCASFCLLATWYIEMYLGICSGDVQAFSLLVEKCDFSLDDPQAQKMKLTTEVALDPDVNWRRRACFPSLHCHGINMVLSVEHTILLHRDFSGLTVDIAPVTSVATQVWTGVSLSAYVAVRTEVALRKGLSETIAIACERAKRILLSTTQTTIEMYSLFKGINSIGGVVHGHVFEEYGTYGEVFE